jgi:hypothetical protein
MVAVPVEKLFESIKPHVSNAEAFTDADGELSDWCVSSIHNKP